MNVKNFFTKVTVVLLACLLIFVGVGNLLSGDDEKEEVARVGKEVITSDEYKSLYQNYGKQISGSDASREQVKKLKYDLLNALIEQKLLFNLTSELGLTVGEESIKNHIKNTKYFQNDKGEFDKNKFHETLNDLHMTEKEYIAKLEKILPAMMFMTSLFKDNYPVTFGEKIDEQIYNSRYQTRVVDIVKITEDAVTNIPEPDDQTLLDLYERNKSHFYYPEYRTAQYISLEQKYFEDQIKISDEEVDGIIEQQELRDQRDIFNIIFSTKEEAETARRAFEEGKTSFEQIVEEFGKAELEETRVNNITKDFLPEDMREKVFALKVGEVSEVLASSFGWHIIKVESAHQISDEDLVDLKKDIKSVLTNQKSFERVNDFINQVNYKIYNGSAIEEILSEYNLPIQTIGPVDASGKDQSGNNVGDSSDLISFIFSREKDQKGYFKGVGDAVVSVKIIDIVPPKSQSFEEGRASAVELWQSEFIKERMFKIGQEFAVQLREKTDWEKIQGVELVEDQQMHRNEQNYPFSFVEEIFNMKTTGSVTDPIQYNNEIIIGVLKEMHSSNGKLNMLDTGKRVMISLKEQLISYLESKYKVEVNHAILDDI
ncbi:MAG: SurA N-terminal domain-containing protein [Wolbachia endosymbiont of Andrena praecox]|uniref:peptidylprolyl isomerase n=1 Tax=Wolbachia endosymbiont (group A) of Aporus unicolor TaxID=3066195 RepID=UPI00004CA67F|nr:MULTISPECIES: peptidylprolyl isomerase [unclassified Wolbachia]EAL59930.1 peptidyl-prolyl cis-trans isomerse D, putative [Wolbachia endosymbiont of Drosophila simulans]MDX5488232.1 SurA N-terminal domain-containing protein [Wolbachia endosymbiont of Andrena praecox]MDX5497647.1 SurA N-terminal domain-containing protein [Wolbachia endosymbiont of Lasioglossum nitidulum]MDX5510009.1 SurA N-terminal domain-containing protein [Wolbachia endosymbiont of Lasioglossum morio]MDX5561776.1 SurA N-ter